MTKLDTQSFGHIPVLFEEYIEGLNIGSPKPNIIVDCTLGLGGHATGIIKKLHPGDTFIGFDLDEDNLKESRRVILDQVGTEAQNKNITLHFLHANFAHLKQQLAILGIESITGICYDLGVSSAHFDDGERGFSYRTEAKLDMRFDRTGDTPSAFHLVNYTGEKELIEIFRKYGEEGRARFIAEAIVRERKTKPIETTKELAELIEKTSYDQKSTLRIFQAIRIAVNDEFGSIETSLRQAVELLISGGRCAVITFHSLEDRLVKQTFAPYLQAERDELTGRDLKPAILKKATKKPIEPTETEIKQNKRSRSAKLRIVEKL
ncbi:MAG: 16S rRNA (cytosine(1402)-N(4))-methyltransferase RsmH [Candidatus Gracilibacteria bacterium]|nr:16S rRNA (cytosine(1402)-N(4))-methyltransferase RsmH [Candidatus Gracilibacteria bacterium]